MDAEDETRSTTIQQPMNHCSIRTSAAIAVAAGLMSAVVVVEPLQQLLLRLRQPRRQRADYFDAAERELMTRMQMTTSRPCAENDEGDDEDDDEDGVDDLGWQVNRLA